MRLLFRKLGAESDVRASTRRERALTENRGHNSQVLKRQSREGAGLDVHNVVVAEVKRFQSEEGSELLHRDPGDPVVCSENIDTIAPINDKNTVYLTSGTHRLHVPSYTNSQVPQLACGIKKCHALAKQHLTTQKEILSGFYIYLFSFFFADVANLPQGCQQIAQYDQCFCSSHQVQGAFGFIDVLFCL